MILRENDRILYIFVGAKYIEYAIFMNYKCVGELHITLYTKKLLVLHFFPL